MVTIVPVTTRAQLRRFVDYPNELYKDVPQFVPATYDDDLSDWDRRKNPAFDYCDARCWLAERDGETVGRIGAIHSRKANDKWGTNRLRFTQVDFIDDPEVSAALFAAVEDWARELGCTAVHGPLGFTDMDAEGMLIEGFDQLSTMATIYNHPYYPKHMEQLGLEKSADWVEMKIYIPETIPEKHLRISNIIQQKYNLHIRKLTGMSLKEIYKTGIGQDIFRLINEAYAPLFGFSKMTERQIESYVKMYVPVLDLRMVTLVENEQNELVAVGISMPSLSEALQKAKGKLLPLGWFHLLKALKWKRPKVLDLLLVAVRPDYQSKGVNALLFTDLIPVYQQLGFEYAESNPELEENGKVQSQWQYFKTEQHKRRRCFKAGL